MCYEPATVILYSPLSSVLGPWPRVTTRAMRGRHESQHNNTARLLSANHDYGPLRAIRPRCTACSVVAARACMVVSWSADVG